MKAAQATRSAPFPDCPSHLLKAVTFPWRAVKGGIQALERYSSPRPSTAGNFTSGSYFQACVEGVKEGFQLLGPAGVVVGGTSSLLGIFVETKTKSKTMGIAAGVSSAIALGALMGGIAGPAGLVSGIIGGALLGSFEIFRGDARSVVRDSAGNTAMVAGTFMPGPAKMGAGIAAALAWRGKSKKLRFLIGAGAGAGIGLLLALSGATGLPPVLSVALNGAAGGIGPFVGPRFSQFYRNLAMDIGKGVEKLGRKAGLLKKPLNEKNVNALGTLPSSTLKEGIRGYILSDGSISGLIAGSVFECAKQLHIVWASKREEPEPSQASQASRHSSHPPKSDEPPHP